jgi:hypothetical protein
VARHAEHDAVRDEVRRWYSASTPKIGLSIVAQPYGFLTAVSGPSARRRLLLTVEAPEEVGPALRAAAEFYGTSDFELWVDDRARAERLAAALRAAGRAPGLATVTLALVGTVRAAAPPVGLRVEEVVDEGQLRQWATTKLQGFADDESLPEPERLESELSARRAEWPVCRYLLAHLGTEPVAILGHYTGTDQMVFLLATRLPYRHRGIAQSLLAGWSEEEPATTVRSRLINCDDGGRPADLYRRLGFTDEVWWYRRFPLVG